jgi:hypothetical protein
LQSSFTQHKHIKPTIIIIPFFETNGQINDHDQ